MVDYDFHQLNDKEFEVLCTDLLSAHFSSHIERFKPGRDGGIDGRFYVNSTNTAIIQCKHYLKSGVSALISKLKSDEKSKVDKISPYQYFLTTSLPLSPNDKDKILNSLSPHIKSTKDIFGQEDLNSLLKSKGNENILKKHHKLWFHGSTILDSILNNKFHQNNAYKIKEISDENKKYVITENHKKSKEKLEEQHTIIIKGLPGIGKTTLAEQLCYEYLADGYELCNIEEKISEGDSQFDPEKKQIFYFDDFLGDVIFDLNNNPKNSRLTRFIKRISHLDNKRFILTSRSNILNEAKNKVSAFINNNIDTHEFEIEINSLSPFDKAKILYNHIWHSGLSEEFINEIYIDRKYLKIIHHKNFNPRIISFITDSHKLKTISRNTYWQHIIDTLNNPKDIWHNVFYTQMDEKSKFLVISIAITGNAIGHKSIYEEELKKIFDHVNDSTTTFNETIKNLTGSLLNRSINYNHKIEYSLFDPSIRDYISSNYKHEYKLLSKILLIDKKIISIKNSKNYLYNFNSPDYVSLIKEIVNNINIDETEDLNFNCHVTNELYQSGYKGRLVKEKLKLLFHLISTFEFHHLNNYHCKSIANYLNAFETKEPKKLSIEKILSWIEKSKDDLDTLSSISKIICEIEPLGGMISTRISDYYLLNLSNNINSILEEKNIQISRSSYDSYNNEDIIYEIDNLISDLSSDNDISTEDILFYCDFERFVDDSYGDDDLYHEQKDFDRSSISTNQDSDIDELFSKD